MKRHALFAAITSVLIMGSWVAIPASARTTDQSQRTTGSTQTTTPPDQNTTTPAKVKKAAPPNQPATLGTITVTATRRAESIDAVPATVTAISGDTLKESGIQDTQSLTMLVPSLLIQSSTSEGYGTQIRLRGIGTTGQNAGLEPGVGVFVDGVYRVNSGLVLQDLYDINRIEVIEGPQSTLYGKNTAAGAINILTNQPTFSPEAHVDASLGNYGSKVFTGVLNGPVSQTLALRLSAHYADRDGFVDDAATGQKYDGRYRRSVRAQALWQPNKTFSLRVIADATRNRDHCCAAPILVYGPKEPILAKMGATLVPAGSYDAVALNDPPVDNVSTSGISVAATWKMDWAKLEAVLSSRHGSTNQVRDIDDTNLDILPNSNGTKFTSKIADITLEGEQKKLSWMVGLFYNNNTVSYDDAETFGVDANAFLQNAIPNPKPFYPAGTGEYATSHQNGHSASVYTNNTLHLGHGINITLGARYVLDNKTGSGVATTDVPTCEASNFKAKLLCGAPAYDTSFRDHNMMESASLSKSIGKGIVYAAYSTGFTAGGINLNPTQASGSDPIFKAETVKGYEIGLKVPDIVNRLSLRADLFTENFTNFQQLALVAANSINIVNEGSVNSKGVEVQGEWALTPEVRMTGSYMYNLARYGNGVAGGATPGQQVNNAPKNVTSLSLQVHHAIGSQILFGNITALYKSTVIIGNGPQKIPIPEGGYTLINARLGLNFQNGISTSLWVSNLTDQHRYIKSLAVTGVTGAFEAFPIMPRTFGIEFRKDFL